MKYLYLSILLAVSFVSHGETVYDGLISHYTFDNDFNDSSGIGNHGYPNDFVSISEGIIGNAAEIDESGIIFLSGYLKQYDTGDITFSFWFKPDSLDQHVNIFTTDNDFSAYYGRSAYAGSGAVYSEPTNEFISINTAGNGECSSPACRRTFHTVENLNPNEWNHVVIIMYSDIYSAKVFINGLDAQATDLQVSNISENTPPGLSDTLRHSDSGIGQIGGFSGFIDDFRVYNRELEEAEIMELFNAPTSSAKPQISVRGGYIKLDLSNQQAPPELDCSSIEHEGRMQYDSRNNRIYICSQSGWQIK